MEVLQIFTQRVLLNCNHCSEANVVLSTVHAAKGMEWHTVQVCNDFMELSTFEATRSRNRSNSQIEYKCQFKCPPYGDELNLWYVAVTRAQMVLAVPTRFTDLVVELQQLCRIQQQCPQPDGLELTQMQPDNKRKHVCGGQAVSLQEAAALHNQLYTPWHNGLLSNEPLVIHGSKASKQISASLVWLFHAARRAGLCEGNRHTLAELVKAKILANLACNQGTKLVY
jgi:ATP-dependent exoDNAse (exonuclease V) beta subunit